MGTPTITDPNEIDDALWYCPYFHHYFKIGGPACSNWVADGSCCVRGIFLKWYFASQCVQGGAHCWGNPDASFSLTQIVGPYDTLLDCQADNPGSGYSATFFTENLTYVIADEYGFFPASESKFEMEIPQYGNAWSFHADNKNNLKLHVRFNHITLSKVL